MTYTKTTWTSSTVLSHANLQNQDSQYAQFTPDLAIHVAAGHTSDYYTKAQMDSYFWDDENDGPGSTLDADTLQGHEASEYSAGAPAGLIVLWGKTIAEIPVNWHLCDGDGGTEDIRGMIPRGAGGYVVVGETGGSASVTPSGAVTVPGHVLSVAESIHSHSLTDYCNPEYSVDIVLGIGGAVHPTIVGGYTLRSSSVAGSGSPHTHTATFAGDSMNNMPPYIALPYMQRI